MKKLRILHLEDSPADALFIEHQLRRGGFDPELSQARNADDFRAVIEEKRPELILVDNGVPGFDGFSALRLAREKCPGTPFIFVSGQTDEAHISERLSAGATDYVSKDHLWQLTTAVRRALAPGRVASSSTPERHVRAMGRLVGAVQELSLARDLDAVMAVVRRAARELAGADGATFVLREGDQCHYADEDAVAPLWKGQRFPMSACVSGWAMLNGRPAVIPDIYADERIPADAYRPTFVRSLVMVPIRGEAPVGAIGTYWARPHHAAAEEVELLQTLANTTSVAMENVRLYAGLEQRIRERTAQLERVNRELESFAYSVSHDLRAPLRAVSGYIGLLAERNSGVLDQKSWDYVTQARSGAARMATLIDDLLRLARITQAELRPQVADLSGMARSILSQLRSQHPDQRAECEVEDGMNVTADARLLQVALENLLSNAWKYSAKKDVTRIRCGMSEETEGFQVFHVRDNGAGFDMDHAGKLFTPFHRLHREDEFSGTGIGLATVRRIVERHGGRIWAEAETGRGAVFHVALPRQQGR